MPSLRKVLSRSLFWLASLAIIVSPNLISAAAADPAPEAGKAAVVADTDKASEPASLHAVGVGYLGGRVAGFAYVMVIVAVEALCGVRVSSALIWP